MENKDQAAAALAMMKAVHEDKKAEINGREYVLMNMTHKNRRSVFAFYSAHSVAISAGNFAFMDTADFERIEKIVSDHVTIDGSLLSKKTNHWEEYPEDYLMFISTMLGVMSYPFLAGNHTA